MYVHVFVQGWPETTIFPPKPPEYLELQAWTTTSSFKQPFLITSINILQILA
jgi:hypothetical protein